MNKRLEKFLYEGITLSPRRKTRLIIVGVVIGVPLLCFFAYRLLKPVYRAKQYQEEYEMMQMLPDVDQQFIDSVFREEARQAAIDDLMRQYPDLDTAVLRDPEKLQELILQLTQQ